MLEGGFMEDGMASDPQREPTGLKEIISAAHAFSSKTEYPVRDFNQFARALGGEVATVTLLGETYTISELRDIVPAEYFPIESEDDLIMKVASGFASAPGTPFKPVRMGEHLPVPPENPPRPHGLPSHPQLTGHQQLISHARG
jgi:hypothetical protein